MASIREVAKRAGVAACTVSRVLNGTVAVSPETRQKIEKAMEELDYIPNELARGMFRRKAGIIAMLVPSIKHPFFASLADCIDVDKRQIKHQVRPGMTGWAQVNGLRGDTSITKRIEHDLYYIENWTLGFDFKILFLTVFKGFINKNAY